MKNIISCYIFHGTYYVVNTLRYHFEGIDEGMYIYSL